MYNSCRGVRAERQSVTSEYFDGQESQQDSQVDESLLGLGAKI